MPFVVESSSASAIQHEVNHLYAELARLLSQLEIPSLPERLSLSDSEEDPSKIDTVDGEIVEDEEIQAPKLEDSSSSPVLPEINEDQKPNLEGSSPPPVLSGEELAGRLRSSDNPQLVEAPPVRLLAPGDELRLEIGGETIEGNWATFPEALKQLPSQQIIDVCQAIEQPENTAPKQISDSIDSIDPINLTVNGDPQFQRDESGMIAINNLYPVVFSVQAETAENQAETGQQPLAEVSDRLTSPETVVLSGDFKPVSNFQNEIPQNETGSAAANSTETSKLVASSLITDPEIRSESSNNLQSLDQPDQSLEDQPLEQVLAAQNSQNLESVEAINHEPENQLLPLAEIERVTGQEISSGPLHDQVVRQSPSMTAHRNALGQFTATQSIKAHVEATEDGVETAAIQQAENQEHSIFDNLSSFFQHNRDLGDLEVSDSNSGIVIQPQESGGFVAQNADGQILSFDGNHIAGDSSLITGVCELAQKAIAAALAHNANSQAAQAREDIERA